MDNVDHRNGGPKPLHRGVLAITVAATLCTGCATTPPDDNAKVAYRAPVYLTGSRIPVGREASGSATSASDPSPNDWQNALPPQLVHGTTGGGY
jgi:hypothetical protein